VSVEIGDRVVATARLSEYPAVGPEI